MFLSVAHNGVSVDTGRHCMAQEHVTGNDFSAELCLFESSLKRQTADHTQVHIISHNSSSYFFFNHPWEMNENMIFCLDDISVASLYPLLIKFLMEHMVFATSTSVRMFWL